MPGSVVVHTAVFAAGALLGGSIAAAMASRKSIPPPNSVSPTVNAMGRAQVPTVYMDASGKTNVAANAIVGPSQAMPPVLVHGNPGPISDTLTRKAYVAAYDRRLRHPIWTAEHLTRASLGRVLGSSSPAESADRSKSAFIEDESIPQKFRAKLADYFRSGYDRGHLVPAADAKFSQNAMDETFLLTNIAPQVGDGFNRHYWAYLEDWCRRLTNSFQDVYVFTVPLYLPKLEADGKWRVTYEVIGNPPNVSVPTHFAKVILASKPVSPLTPDIHEVSSGAFVLPNATIRDEAPLESFVVPVDAVERATGLTLFPDAIKATSKHICTTTKCEVIVRRFDDAQKKLRSSSRKSISAPQ